MAKKKTSRKKSSAKTKVSKEDKDSETTNMDPDAESLDKLIEGSYEELPPDPLANFDYNISDLPGVGAATAKKIREAGYDSLQALVMVPPATIMEDCGLGEKTVLNLIKAARDILGLSYESADKVWEKRKRLSKISVGSKAIDELLGGGVETGGMTELFGEYRTGKTQICHQLCINVQLPKSQGGLDGNALYIDTEGTFRPERLIQMAQGKGLDPKEALKRVFTARAYNSQHQVILIKDAHRQIRENNIKLIIVDSLIAHFRSEYIGRGTLAGRQQLLNQHIHDLLRMADIYPDLAVVVTNQVQSKPDVFFGDPNRAAGGNIVAHAATTRCYLRKGKGEQRVMKLIDSPNLPEGECVFVISEEGIVDV
ncbi:MAG: DNA repair and recombination protein RadA [Promethearchaeota archaeon]